MSDRDLIDFSVWREMDEDITDEQEKQAALEASQEAIAELAEEEDVDVEWVRTDVLEDPDGDVDCAYCHYRAPSQDAIEEHSERAGLPVTKLTRLDDQLDREAVE
ncbi:nickel-binding protein [Halomicrobium urmianum]|uniref:nickel-binding protein n=1 Tax=Halomicrobium urmianum TaxID=1586233 RepID=UPI001CDA288A|nr:nickel-binding protein [Halomicrobium urmianum]